MAQVSYNLNSVYAYRRKADAPEFLLIRRAPDDFMGGTWEPIYGTCKAGESSACAALREMREETSLDPTAFFQLNLIETFFIAVKDTIYHCPVFVAEVEAKAEVVLNEEHDAIKWLNAIEMREQLVWATQKHVFDQVLELILGKHPYATFLRISM